MCTLGSTPIQQKCVYYVTPAAHVQRYSRSSHALMRAPVGFEHRINLGTGD